MSAAVHTPTIDLLEIELARARSALHEVQPSPLQILSLDDVTTGALAAHKNHLISYDHDFFAGSAARLTAKELGLISVQEIVPTPEEEICPPLPVIPTNIFDLLANSVVLHHLIPLLPVSALMSLASTNKAVRSVVMETPYVFRHLDLSTCRVAQIPERKAIDAGGEQWRNERMDESVTEDEFYAGPLRGIFSRLERQSLLGSVRTLILDGLSVPADLVADIILTDRFNVNILSIRECSHLNELRPTRPAKTPKVKGIYYFTPKESNEKSHQRRGSSRREWWQTRVSGQSTSRSATDPESQQGESLNEWYKPFGKVLKRNIEAGWAQTLKKCEGIISFDAVLCRGPRHNADLYASTNKTLPCPGDPLLPAAIATVSLGPRGCDGCRTSPEGPAIWAESPDSHFPLLNPLPLYASNITDAKRPVPRNETAVMFARCADCLQSRWCHQCHKWFCFNCLPRPEEAVTRLSPHQTVIRRPGAGEPRDFSPERLGPGVSRDCWECGPTCASCKLERQRSCGTCYGEYCLKHNDGCSSTKLILSTPAHTSRSLPGDKILLPPSALEQLLSAAPVVQVDNPQTNFHQQHTSIFDPFNPYTFAAESRARAYASSGGAQQQPQLPHPLTFRLVNPRNGRVVYAGIREFSAEEGHVCLSKFLLHALELDGQLEKDEKEEEVTVTVHAQQLPKGTYVRLRPLEAGYDPEDWKALLERHLRENFTTLTVGELLTVPSGRGRFFEFLIDKVAPEEGGGSGICIVDTDLEVDIEPLNEEQARETLQKLSQKAARKPGSEKGSSPGGPIKKGQQIQGRVKSGDYVDYELSDTAIKEGGRRLQLELEAVDGADLDIFVSPFSAYQRAQPRSDEHVFGDMSSKSFKVLKLDSSLPEMADAEKLYVSVHAFSLHDEDDTEAPFEFMLRVVDTVQADGDENMIDVNEHNPDEVQCKNCQQWVPRRTLFLHENFCLRNNILCPKCKNVFQKSSSEWQNHWHCEHDESYGNDKPSKEKHDYIFHKSHSCFNCDYTADNLPSLAHHRTTRCPGKLILCQFCHLVVPQQGDSDPDMNDPEVLLSGLTPHEIIDGGRTTECHLCNKIIRLRDMKTHLRHHDLERLSRPAPSICRNVNCGHAHDPEGKALKRRIERRYLSQMLTGCGKSWCRNVYCKTGHPNSSSASTELLTSSKEILQVIKPLIASINTQPNQTDSTAEGDRLFYLCADEMSQQRRVIGELIAAEGVYDLRWCLAALEASSGDLEKAREWMSSWAPRKDEQR
ncbi:ubiquitin fusion degradation protein (Ufd1), putative [Talaromyces stipitatus ATCC 10500]|uniref:Ubiquitin fusion degradation protein (Ufd1), putative n=1 Tax=Talaromyces stipitatus (strain ATCC 10500 / CBS 375.48 / QM 6759 / NRRL 1006) TaxID=441959 RepID=B8MA43_TALSN|nr:ubiquitin fusion degradation protein (Ufd1), putative [Talaromyces stipitatus ATCC 10500]EED18372.1 ubiquitin fusion degradation protein (Ufd1), putative [Talaromyces stipitatus ATCC 10500]